MPFRQTVWVDVDPWKEIEIVAGRKEKELKFKVMAVV